MKKLWLSGLALGASLALGGAVAAQEISVGMAGPLTGSEASFGAQLKNGAELAVADINAAGGVLGRKLKLEIGDDACEPKQARAIAERMGSQKVVFVAGHFCSGSSIPASEAYAEANVLQITPAPVYRSWTLEHVPRLRP
jgi:branched-chain amino acid transport system substrate-binding protein